MFFVSRNYGTAIGYYYDVERACPRNWSKEVSNSVLFRKQYFENCRLNVGVHLYSSGRIEREFSSVNSRAGLAYPFEGRSSRGLRQHSGVSTRFRYGPAPGRSTRIKNRSEIGPGFVLAGQKPSRSVRPTTSTFRAG